MARETQRRGYETTPPRPPETTPSLPQYQGSDYSFTLQTVMEMQKAVGELTQAVRTLTQRSDEHGGKIDKISHRIYAAGVVITVVGGVVIFFLNKIADLIVDVLTSHAHP